jgi:phage shock protein PspC (stress-responsive transcriptional regulator)
MNEHADTQPAAGEQAGHSGSPFAARYGLVRPLQGRYLGGVCAAIGRATNTDPVLWRVLLAVTSFVGIGLVIYLAGWLLIPAEGDTASPVEALLGRGQSRTSPVVTVLLGGLALLVLGFMLTDGFRGPLLIISVVLAGVLLLGRNAERGRAPAGRAPTGPAKPAPLAEPAPPTTPYHPTSPYAASYQPAAGPYAATYTAPPGTPVATGAGGTAPPSVPPGYRAPFAPYGPYASGGPAHPPHPPAAGPPQPPRPPRPPREPSRLGIVTLSLMVLALGAVAALDLANVANIGVAGYFAAMLAMVGAGLLVGAWFGRARWLISLGVVLAIGLGVATAAERLNTGTIGSSVVWRPTTVAELIEEDPYALSLGSAELDMRQIDFTGQSAAVTVEVNLGQLKVILPANVDTTVQAEVNAGDATIFGVRRNGVRSPARDITDLGQDGEGGGELRLTVRVNAGNVEVRR